jgi:hypothetical protein
LIIVLSAAAAGSGGNAPTRPDSFPTAKGSPYNPPPRQPATRIHIHDDGIAECLKCRSAGFITPIQGSPPCDRIHQKNAGAKEDNHASRGQRRALPRRRVGRRLSLRVRRVPCRGGIVIYTAIANTDPESTSRRRGRSIYIVYSSVPRHQE